ncbi:MAG: ABC transporter ATP-binding protein [Lachnospiraceae bacterium]|jgi:ABC-2 type transport system ATP-binding protein|nr:ABC transporter ATP-binding protein [Lachnospiraceae bacterium]MCI1327550.1 ABC transporter ATP-binding protein [Lachnospiraceae bacterium]
MIELKNVTKRFGEISALNRVSLTVNDHQIFGLIGSNGAGKSTMLRMIAGVVKADSGEVLIDGKPVFENPAVKQEICFLPDTGYFFQNATPIVMQRAYQMQFPKFDAERFAKLLAAAGLSPERRIRTFSKGMQKQLSVLLGVSAGTKYLLCDEIFDGLDPAIRQAVKSIFAREMIDRDFIPVIASHNLRELEDICDHVGLIHQGGILLSEDLDDLRYHMQKVQCVIRDPAKEERLLAGLDVMRAEHQGSLLTFIVRGTHQEIMDLVQGADPLFAESIPLTLEEIFIYETEVAGYDVKALIS